MRHLTLAFLLVALVVAVPSAEPRVSEPLFLDQFGGSDRFVANDLEYWSSDEGQSAPTSAPPVATAHPTKWFVTSGSLFVRNGRGWDGVPDVGPADQGSVHSTGSAIFRAHTARTDLGDVVVSLEYRLLSYTVAPGATRHDWDGLQLMVRLHGEDELYTIAVARRDGQIVAKRKLPGGDINGGNYTTIVATESQRVVSSDRHHLRLLAQNVGPNQIRLALEIDGSEVFDVVDEGADVAPLLAPGAVGLRSDNLEFEVDDVLVTAASEW